MSSGARATPWDLIFGGFYGFGLALLPPLEPRVSGLYSLAPKRENHPKGVSDILYENFRKQGVPYFGGPYNKDPTIWGTILRSPIFGNPHIVQLDPHPEPRAYKFNSL